MAWKQGGICKLKGQERLLQATTYSILIVYISLEGKSKKGGQEKRKIIKRKSIFKK